MLKIRLSFFRHCTLFANKRHTVLKSITESDNTVLERSIRNTSSSLNGIFEDAKKKKKKKLSNASNELILPTKRFDEPL